MHLPAECRYLKSQIPDHKPTFCNQTGLKPEESSLFGEDKDSGEGLELHFALNSSVLNPSLQPTETGISEVVTKRYISDLVLMDHTIINFSYITGNKVSLTNTHPSPHWCLKICF